jgi:hypothetical protein
MAMSSRRSGETRAAHNLSSARSGFSSLVVGRVLELVEGTAAEPLLFYRSGYRKLD